jgi:hypothetical protein
VIEGEDGLHLLTEEVQKAQRARDDAQRQLTIADERLEQLMNDYGGNDAFNEFYGKVSGLVMS